MAWWNRVPRAVTPPGGRRCCWACPPSAGRIPDRAKAPPAWPRRTKLRQTDAMLIAGAVCPHPPLLIPAALGSAASDPPAELRKASEATTRAVATLAAARPDLLVVVGGGAAEREYGADASGGLHAFGVGVTVGASEPVLPLSLTVGRWLLEQAGILKS